MRLESNFLTCSFICHSCLDQTFSALVVARPINHYDAHMAITKTSFGQTPAGMAVDLFTLTNDRGGCAKIASYGATLTQLHMPDRHGDSGNVVLGFDFARLPSANTPYFGCTVGRFANRIGNAGFTLDGVTYKHPANDGPHTLHGGTPGFDRAVWQAWPPTKLPMAPSEIISLPLGPDLDQGFPATSGSTPVPTP